MKMLRLVLAVLLLTCLIPGLLAESENIKLNRVLHKFYNFHNTMRTFQAEILQRKYLKILEEFDQPEKGKLALRKTSKGLLLRKEMEEPVKTVLLVNETEIMVFYPKKNQVIRRKLNEQQNKVKDLGFGSSPADLKKNFEVRFVSDELVKKKVYHVIKLIPVNPNVKRYFEELRIWIDSEKGSPFRIQIEEQNGDYTDMQLMDIKINDSIKEKTFELKLPKNVEVIS